MSRDAGHELGADEVIEEAVLAVEDVVAAAQLVGHVQTDAAAAPRSR